MEVHCDEGVANHIGPEPCAGIREDAGEASAGDRIGQPLRRFRPRLRQRWRVAGHPAPLPTQICCEDRQWHRSLTEALEAINTGKVLPRVRD